jgi:hypothetical protein
LDLFSAECSVRIGYWEKFFLKVFAPAIFAVMLITAIILMEFFQSKKRNERMSQQKLKSSIISSICVIYANFFTLILATTFSPFQCVQQPNGSYVMLKNPSEFCYQGSWSNNIWIAIAFALIYIVIIPFFLLQYLYKNRHNLDNPEVLRTYGNLYAPYKAPFYFWEFVKLFQRALFVVVASSLWSTSQATRMFFALLVLFASLAVETIWFPYKSSATTKMVLL